MHDLFAHHLHVHNLSALHLFVHGLFAHCLHDSIIKQPILGTLVIISSLDLQLIQLVLFSEGSMQLIQFTNLLIDPNIMFGSRLSN